jgi:hypothetical protein
MSAVYLSGVTIQKLKRDQVEKLNFNVDFNVLTPDKLVNKRDSSENVVKQSPTGHFSPSGIIHLLKAQNCTTTP